MTSCIMSEDLEKVSYVGEYDIWQNNIEWCHPRKEKWMH